VLCGRRIAPLAEPAWPRRFRPGTWRPRQHHRTGRHAPRCWHLGDRTCLGVDALPVGPIDLHHPHPFGEEESGEAGAVGAGALDPDQVDLAERSNPGQRGPVARRGRVERLDP
jgi:hypothetical protein